MAVVYALFASAIFILGAAQARTWDDSAAASIIAVGGDSKASYYSAGSYLYNVSTNGWSTAARLNTPRNKHGVAAVGQWVFAVGGVSNNTCVNSVERYEKNAWTTVAPLLTGRWQLAVAALNGELYAIGGGDVHFRFLSTVEKYNPEQDKWQNIASMATVRYGPGAVVLNNNCLFVFGGYNNDRGAVSSCELYCPAMGDKWLPAASMQQARYLHGSAAHNTLNFVTAMGGHAYACGGFNTRAHAPIDSCEKYDPATNQWSMMQALPSARYALSMTALGGKLYAAGGLKALMRGRLGQVLVFDPEANKWSRAADLPTKLSYFGIAPISKN